MMVAIMPLGLVLKRCNVAHASGRTFRGRELEEALLAR
jgi:hypothetical protein